MIALSSDQVDIVRSIISEFAPEAHIFIFGSRADGSAKPYSDLDIALKQQHPIDKKAINRIIIAFSDSDLPFRVDVLDWHTLTPEFKRIIEADLSPLP